MGHRLDQRKSSIQEQNNTSTKHGIKACNNDELVKNMSNLPGFLQQVEKGKSVQAKALNFGVLDWKKLEQWKYNERMPTKCHNKTTPSSKGPVWMTKEQPKIGANLRNQPKSNGFNPSSLSLEKDPNLLVSKQSLEKETSDRSSTSNGQQNLREKVKRNEQSESKSSKVQEKTTRHPSPNRFTFGLGKFSRNSSSKENSKFSQSGSKFPAVKSGPVPEVSSATSNNDSSRGRSSPLRRLLDPFLKHKGSQSTEFVRPPNRPLNTKKTEGSKFHGLLQITMKNNLPFFKLVFDNSSSDMLAAVIKNVPYHKGSDHFTLYEFYSVHEIKKKSTNWIQELKIHSKSQGLGYNILAQMKISSYSRQCCVRECVLYGVDKQSPDYLPNKEILAVVVKNMVKNFDPTVVILSGGSHGAPSKGGPSSLIGRWKSGGSCDCGGWDVGCKLRVITNYNDNGKIIESSKTDGSVILFDQGQEQKGTPVFNLEPFGNGFYSLGLDSSISLLEAFATCVAFITCTKFSEILDANVIDKTATFQGQVPAKYVTCPPPSPFRRI